MKYRAYAGFTGDIENPVVEGIMDSVETAITVSAEDIPRKISITYFLDSNSGLIAVRVHKSLVSLNLNTLYKVYPKGYSSALKWVREHIDDDFDDLSMDVGAFNGRPILDRMIISVVKNNFSLDAGIFVSLLSVIGQGNGGNFYGDLFESIHEVESSFIAEGQGIAKSGELDEDDCRKLFKNERALRDEYNN